MTVQMTAQHARVAASKKRAWIIVAAVAAAGVTAAGVTAYRIFTPDELPRGVHPVAVYTIDDDQTTSGANGNHLLGMCGSEAYYIKFGSTEQCVVLNGSLGTVRADGTEDGIVLDATAAAAVKEMVRKTDEGASTRTARVLLEYDGSPVAVLPAAALAAGGPVTATTLG